MLKGRQMNNRKIVFKWSTLPYHVRIEIGESLNLLDEKSYNLNSSDLNLYCFQQAKEKDIIDKLIKQTIEKSKKYDICI